LIKRLTFQKEKSESSQGSEIVAMFLEVLL